MWVRCPRCPSSSFIVSSVVVQLPGRPRLLQWRCTGCGRRSSSTACATAAMIWRGVTPKWSTAVSRSLTFPACRCFQRLDAARIHELRGIALRRAEQPADERLHLLGLASRIDRMI